MRTGFLWDVSRVKLLIVFRDRRSLLYTPDVDSGDFVVVVNAEKIKLTGNKLEDKKYYRHSGYIGGMKATNYATLIKEKPDFVIQKAVKGMLPKSKLGRVIIKKLKVYSGADHPHGIQNPKPYQLTHTKNKEASSAE